MAKTRKKYVVLQNLNAPYQKFWTTNTNNNTHSIDWKLLYEELLFTDSEETAIAECDKKD